MALHSAAQANRPQLVAMAVLVVVVLFKKQHKYQ
jgi:hypothetical protein